MSESTFRVTPVITLDDGNVTSTTVAEDEYAAWDGGTTYAAGESVIYGHKIYTGLLAANLNNNPATATNYWQEIGPTNAWAMFDTAKDTVTHSGSGDLVVVLEPGEVDSIYVDGLTGVDTVHVVILDAPGGTSVYDETITLAGATVPAWEGVFATPSYTKTKVVFRKAPKYAACEITVTISGSDVHCARLQVGTSNILGSALAGATVTLVRRDASRRMDVRLWLDNSQLPKIAQFLEELGDTACIWQASDKANMDLFLMLGTYAELAVEVPWASNSYCSLQIEGA